MKGEFYYMKANKHTSPADRGINLVLAVIIIAVLAVGSVAVYRKVSDNMLTKAIADGTAPQTVATLAKQAGQSVDEYLADYGLSDSDVKGDTSTTDFLNNLTVKYFAAYNGEDFDSFVETYGLTDKVTEDTLWPDAEKLIPFGIYIGGSADVNDEDTATQLESIKSTYGLDDSVNASTPWGEVQPIIEAKQQEMAAASDSDSDASEEAPAADASTENGTSDAAQTENTSAAE
jgi:hypothetical protein